MSKASGLLLRHSLQARRMKEIDHSVESFDALHNYVHQTLCESENLLSDQFKTSKIPLFTKDRLCAMEYSLLGPRSLRLAAIWAAEQNVIYFYNARGERNLKVKLTERIPIPDFDQSSVA